MNNGPSLLLTILTFFFLPLWAIDVDFILVRIFSGSILKSKSLKKLKV